MRKRIEVPGPLHAQVAHAARFGRALDALLQETPEDDRAAVWLVGRSSEVSAFVRDVVREWCAGRLDAARAAREIEAYVHSLHRSVRKLFGEAFTSACCRKHGSAHSRSSQHSIPRRRFDSSAPTLTSPDGRLAFS